MNFNTSDSHFWRNLLTRTTLIIVTVVLIVWFLPRNESQRFRYDVGKPWMYGSFIAKFDFPIYKTDEAIKEEQDSLMRIFQPYYNYNIKVETEQLNKLRANFKDGIPGLPKEYMSILIDRLHRLYQAGIMNAPDYSDLSKDSTNMFRMVNGKEAQSIRISSVYSTMSAYEQIFLDENLAPQRQILQKCNLNNYIVPNLIYDKERSQTELNDLLSGISPASGMVLSGQKIIDRGEIINDYDFRVLSSFEREMQRRSASTNEITSTIIGQILYVTMLVLLFTMYLALFRKDYFEKPRSILMLYVMIVVFPILVSLMMKHNIFSVYILPFAMAPIFIRVFMDTRTAFITHVTMILICAAAVKYQYEFIIVQLVAGLVAIYSLRELSKRAQVFKTALLVTIGSCVIYFALQLMQENDITKLDQSMYYHFCVNGVFLLLAYPLMYLIEKTFGFTSNVTLFELSNTNKGLLRNLSEIAPGTFQHSITVGNLASEIANKIGANSLLVRTGALYHDIGKMTNPVFFTENQSGVNPHENMSYKDSAQIIIGHVTEGVKLAEKSNLPTSIKNFILTHHGHGLAKYFYIKYKNDHPDEEVDTEPFTYPGPNPFTREQAVLMMADTVEAASRSLPEYTEESISTLVDKLIDQQVADGFFKECPITFRDIAQAKQVLIERLMAIYHTRIQYPELN
ncbi:MAG: HDIG domain-containing protein [Prevotella sp.]|jgi:putative nucleotidyltransferase with HDIG domain|nr:HDIG domain-containing protein [Prevotella sp.]MCI1282472.1 HDIG domain-containing protein [Prevotella sp.]